MQQVNLLRGSGRRSNIKQTYKQTGRVGESKETGISMSEHDF